MSHPISKLKSTFSQPLDKVAISLCVALAVLTILLLLGGDRSVPRVRDFSWSDRTVSANDRAFILTFTRPMNLNSVEENLTIDPPLPGKISWAGRRMAYTLEYPASYGTDYTLRLASARDRFTEASDTEHFLDPFEGTFQSHDRAFVYLGSEETERGQLILYNFTRDAKIVLTPADLTVMDFQLYPDGDRVLFSAIDRGNRDAGLTDTQLFTVTTGLDFDDTNTEPPGKIDRVLDNQTYQNLQFALSPDGSTIVVQRANRKNPGADFGLWVVRDGQAPKKFEALPGGEFVIAPNSQELAIAQGQGIALISLAKGDEGNEPLQFFPQYGRIMGFTNDGNAAVMVKFNTDYTRSLFLVPSSGDPQELLNTTGSILQAQFDPSGRYLYCLLTELIEAEEYIERPYILALDLENETSRELLRFETSPIDLHMSLSPDGRAILFDRLLTDTDTNRPDVPLTDSGDAIASSQLWALFPLATADGELAPQPQPERLPLDGFRPRWLP
ncbi:hypothetical protein [Baaleninema simplex]|uniref:hypothetical protein n=1 Tax=Baaleninema simplex TaxID=2862350 RepID=UPI000688A2F9|nr:hypothetical protein [Baaleninema simplex]